MIRPQDLRGVPWTWNPHQKLKSIDAVLIRRIMFCTERSFLSTLAAVAVYAIFFTLVATLLLLHSGVSLLLFAAITEGFAFWVIRFPIFLTGFIVQTASFAYNSTKLVFNHLITSGFLQLYMLHRALSQQLDRNLRPIKEDKVSRVFWTWYDLQTRRKKEEGDPKPGFLGSFWTLSFSDGVDDELRAEIEAHKRQVRIGREAEKTSIQTREEEREKKIAEIREKMLAARREKVVKERDEEQRASAAVIDDVQVDPGVEAVPEADVFLPVGDVVDAAKEKEDDDEVFKKDSSSKKKKAKKAKKSRKEKTSEKENVKSAANRDGDDDEIDPAEEASEEKKKTTGREFKKSKKGSTGSLFKKLSFNRSSGSKSEEN